MRSRTALFVPSFDHTASHMFGVAKLLAGRGFECVFVLTWPNAEATEAACRAKGFSPIVAKDPFARGERSAGGPVSPGRVRRRAKRQLPRSVVDVVGVPRRLVRLGRQALRARAGARDLLESVRPSVVVYTESRTMVMSAYVVREAMRRGIPTVLAPREITQSRSILEVSRARAGRTLRSASVPQRVLQLLASSLVGANVAPTDERPLFVPPERAIVGRLSGVWPADPWTRGKDLGTVFAVQSEAQRDVSVEEGVDPGKIRVTGFPDHDGLFDMVGVGPEERSIRRAQVCAEAGLDPSRLVVLYAGAASKQYTELAAITNADQYHRDVRYVIETLLACSSEVQVLYKVHPRDGEEDYPETADLAGRVRMLRDVEFDRLLLACDAFVATFSSTIYRALALGIPTMTFDFHGTREYEEMISGLPGQIKVTQREGLPQGCASLISEAEGQKEAGSAQGASNPHFIVDGGSTERMAALVAEMAGVSSSAGTGDSDG